MRHLPLIGMRPILLVAMAVVGSLESTTPGSVAMASYGLEGLSVSQVHSEAFSGYGFDAPPVSYEAEYIRHVYGVDTAPHAGFGPLGNVREFLTGAETRIAQPARTPRPMASPGNRLKRPTPTAAERQRVNNDSRATQCPRPNPR